MQPRIEVGDEDKRITKGWAEGRNPVGIGVGYIVIGDDVGTSDLTLRSSKAVADVQIESPSLVRISTIPLFPSTKEDPGLPPVREDQLTSRFLDLTTMLPPNCNLA